VKKCVLPEKAIFQLPHSRAGQCSEVLRFIPDLYSHANYHTSFRSSSARTIAPTEHAQFPFIFSRTGNSRNVGIDGPIIIGNTYIQYKYWQYQYKKKTILQCCTILKKYLQYCQQEYYIAILTTLVARRFFSNIDRGAVVRINCDLNANDFSLQEYQILDLFLSELRSDLIICCPM